MAEFKLFNSEEYAFRDIKVYITGGVYVTRLQSINLRRSVETVPIYTIGQKPTAIKRGKISYGGSISVTQTNLITLKRHLGGSVLTASPFDVYIAYSKPLEVLGRRVNYPLDMPIEY